MAKNKPASNPFYVVLIVVGTLFALTACAYGVMAVVQLEPARAAADAAGEHPLIGFMDRHGVSVMMVQLGLLALATFAAIGTDDYWARRTGAQQASSARTDAGTES